MKSIRIAMLGLACAAFAMPAFAQRDSYMCYKSKVVSTNFAGGTLFLDDILTGDNPQELDALSGLAGVEGSYAAGKAKELCVPTDVNGAGIADASTGYLTYSVKRAGDGVCTNDIAIPCDEDGDCIGGTCTISDAFDKKSSDALSIAVADGFVTLPVDFGKELTVMVPSSVDPVSFQPPPSDKEAYKCYSVKATKASCVGGNNDGESCKDNSTCSAGGGVCTANAKFPKQTHPSGLSASIEDSIGDNADPSHPERTLSLSKLKTFCQAVDTKEVGAAVEGRNAEQAGLLCYAGKAAKAACEGGANDGAVCKSDTDCTGGICRAEPKSTGGLGLKVANELGNSTVDAAKDAVLCVQACRNYEPGNFTDFVAHVSHLSIGATSDPNSPLFGLPRGVDVDNNPLTSAPFDQTDGIDNGLGVALIQGLLNPLLQDELDAGGFSLLFQASQFANGAVTISGFSAPLADNPGCSGGDPNSPPLDPANPADPCTYDLTGLGSTCVAASSNIQIGVTISGFTSGVAGTASAAGGGPGNSFTLPLDFGGQSFEITAQNVKVDADITHDGADLQVIKGVLGGAVDKQALVDAISALPNACVGGANDGLACTTNANCPGGTCALSEDIPFTSAGLASTISSGFPGDINLNGNADPADPNNPNEALSIGLGFQATSANYR